MAFSDLFRKKAEKKTKASADTGLTIHDLTEEQRDILYDAIDEGRKPKDIAEEMNIPVRIVYKEKDNLRRRSSPNLDALKDQLEEYKIKAILADYEDQQLQRSHERKISAQERELDMQLKQLEILRAKQDLGIEPSEEEESDADKWLPVLASFFQGFKSTKDAHENANMSAFSDSPLTPRQEEKSLKAISIDSTPVKELSDADIVKVLETRFTKKHIKTAKKLPRDYLIQQGMQMFGFDLKTAERAYDLVMQM